MADADAAGEPGPAALGESFAALIGGSEWQVEVPADLPPPAELESPPTASAGPHAPTRSASVPTEAPPSPVQIVEALLFAGGPPLRPERACEIIRGLTPDQFRECVAALNARYRTQNRPYVVTSGEAGCGLALKPRFRSVREKLFGGPREARLSQPALDVLALVAYRQPATRDEVDGLRGANSGALLRQLVRLGLIAVDQRGEAAKSDVAYGTTARFLEVFGLRSLDDLPRTGDPQRL